jgi:hypothetical protein
MLTEKGTRRVELARVLEENDTTARLMHAAVATWHMLRPIQVDTNSHMTDIQPVANRVDCVRYVSGWGVIHPPK